RPLAKSPVQSRTQVMSVLPLACYTLPSIFQRRRSRNMRKVRLAINVSLDGYVARPNGALDWVFRTITPAQQAWTTAFLREADTILIGHTTYLEQAAFWPTQTGEMATLMNSHAKIVFSSRLGALEWNHSRLARADVAEELARLKREPGRDIYVTG